MKDVQLINRNFKKIQTEHKMSSNIQTVDSLGRQMAAEMFN